MTLFVGVQIVQIGDHMQSISPGNTLTFQAFPKPGNAGPFTAAMVAWKVTGDPGAILTQSPTNPLIVTLGLASTVVIGATLDLNVQITNENGSVISTTETVTVVASPTSIPGFIPAWGATILQTS